MTFDRRTLFGAGAASLAVGAAAARAEATGPSRAWSEGQGARYGDALHRLKAYVEDHRAAHGLPGVTLVVVDADGYTGFVTSGWSDVAARRPVQAADLFHIGSISKSITALCVFKALADGRLKLDDDVRTHLDGLQIEGGAPVTLQHLLNHSSGLADDAPVDPRPTGRLWLGYPPGSRWSYSNLGYDLLSQVVERASGRPLHAAIAQEVFAPLSLATPRPALHQEERALYAKGYLPAQMDLPFPRGGTLVEAPFEDFTAGSGCVGMATPDMARYLRFLIGAGRGQGGAVLPDALARRWVEPTVDAPGWAPGARYANGLAVVQVDGRSLLHHTGGMLGFSSSLHVDPEAGIACFASANISGYLDYRPRDITGWACGLFRSTRAGAPAPTPKPTTLSVDKPSDFAGVFTSRAGERLEVRAAGAGLEMVVAGQGCVVEADGDQMLIHHPRFARYAFLVEREGGRPVAIWWGETEYAAPGHGFRGPPAAELAALAGRYDAPFLTTRIVARATGLFADGVTPLTRLPDGAWRPGADSWTPERVRFDAVLNGRPRRLNLSGADFLRMEDAG